MKVEVIPHGAMSQKHYEELIAEGRSASEASEASTSVEFDWPGFLRLPVPGDVFHFGWVQGKVRTVTFLFDEIDESLEVRIKLE